MGNRVRFHVRAGLAGLALLALLAAGCRNQANPAATAPAPATAAPAAAAAGATVIPGSIAVLLPDDAPDGRWATQDGPALQRCLSDVGVPFTMANAGDAATQAQQAAAAIAGGARVLLLAQVDNAAGAAVLAAARAEGIKVIDYDRLTTGGPGADLYVGFDPQGIGRLMGETLAPFIRALPVARRTVALLVGPAGDSTALLVGQGLRDAVEPSVAGGQWTLLADATVADAAAARAQIDALLAGGQPVGAVLASDEALAGAAADALRAAGQDPARLAGRGTSVATLQRLVAGEQTMTVYEPLGPLAGAACQAAAAVLNGDEIVSLTTRAIDNGAGDVPFIRVLPIAVTEDNLAETVIADGVADWADICVGALAEECP